jgi:hypothetical protein
MRVDIYIGTDQVKLFGEENIEVNSSVNDIEDITKNTTDYSKTFTVPASAENNKLFKHWYNADVDNSFDARIKVDGKINLDGMLFRNGKFRLTKVSVKHGAPSSYTINFWGNLVDLKDTLGKDELGDLDLDVYNHTRNSFNVSKGLTTSLAGGDLIYSLLVKKQYFYTSLVTNQTMTDTTANIAWGDGSGSNGVAYTDLNPSLRIIRIIEAIEADYSLTFSRDFFGRTEFTDLFLWLNKTKDESVGGGTQVVNFDGGDSPYMNLASNIAYYPLATLSLSMVVYPVAGYESVRYTLKTYVNESVLASRNFTGASNSTFSLSEASYVYYTIESTDEFKCTVDLSEIGVGPTTHATGTSTGNTIGGEFLTSNNMPKIKILDFLKGLFKMFKLVVIPQDDGTLYVNNLNSYYAEGGVYDITNYVDYDNFDVSRGTVLNEINFLFQEPSTILNKTFEENTGVAYGDAEIKLKDENGLILDGDTLEFTLPFEQVLYERLTDLNDSVQTNIQYGAIIDTELNPVNPKGVIHYNVVEAIGTKHLAFINDSGTKVELSDDINTPSSTIDFDLMNFSTLFDSEFSTWNGLQINKTLYKNYHEKYILSIFNIKKREFNYKTKQIPLRVLLKLQLNDLLQIKERFYRISNFKSNLVTGEMDFKLTNSFDDVINAFDASPTNFIVSHSAQQLSTYVTNLGNFSYNKVDVGDGVGWVSVTNTLNNVLFDLDGNSSGVVRNIIIDLIQAVTLKEERIYIRQGTATGVATFDSDSVTFDNTSLTFDNG